MKLKVLSWHDIAGGYHYCTDLESDDAHRIDLLVDGGMDAFAECPQDLVGKVVELDYAIPHIEIGMGVRLANETNAPSPPLTEAHLGKVTE